jgi:hypothetical protein
MLRNTTRHAPQYRAPCYALLGAMLRYTSTRYAPQYYTTRGVERITIILEFSKNDQSGLERTRSHCGQAYQRPPHQLRPTAILPEERKCIVSTMEVYVYNSRELFAATIDQPIYEMSGMTDLT